MGPPLTEPRDPVAAFITETSVVIEWEERDPDEVTGYYVALEGTNRTWLTDSIDR